MRMYMKECMKAHMNFSPATSAAAVAGSAASEKPKAASALHGAGGGQQSRPIKYKQIHSRSKILH